MKKLSLLAASMGLAISFTASAVEFGSYTSVSSSDAYQGVLFFGFKSYQTNERGSAKTSYLCIDNTSRRVPGKVIDGRCWVEWNGKGYANSNFKILNDRSYEWESVHQSYRDEAKAVIFDRGVTNGIIERGEYVYHCRVKEFGSSVVFGKYIPADNGCYYELYGAQFATDSNGDDRSIQVLVAKP